MLLTIAIIILILWALGFFAFHVAGGWSTSCSWSASSSSSGISSRAEGPS